MLGYGLTKTKHLVLSGQIRSIKDGGNRRILPEWVDEYIGRKVEEMSSSEQTPQQRRVHVPGQGRLAGLHLVHQARWHPLPQVRQGQDLRRGAAELDSSSAGPGKPRTGQL